MIVVRVELHSAINGSVTELARMVIANVGGTLNRGDYKTYAIRGRDKNALDKGTPQRRGVVTNYPRLDLHVWNLVARALSSMKYG